MNLNRLKSLGLAILLCAGPAAAQTTDTFSLNFTAIKFDYTPQKESADLLVVRVLSSEAASGDPADQDDDVLYDPADDLLPPPKPIDGSPESVTLSCCTAAAGKDHKNWVELTSVSMPRRSVHVQVPELYEVAELLGVPADQPLVVEYLGSIRLGDDLSSEPIHRLAFAGQSVRIQILAADASTASLGLAEPIAQLTGQR